jgi:hypothetical protein
MVLSQKLTHLRLTRLDILDQDIETVAKGLNISDHSRDGLTIGMNRLYTVMDLFHKHPFRCFQGSRF